MERSKITGFVLAAIIVIALALAWVSSLPRPPPNPLLTNRCPASPLYNSAIRANLSSALGLGGGGVIPIVEIQNLADFTRLASGQTVYYGGSGRNDLPNLLYFIKDGAAFAWICGAYTSV